MLNNILKSVNNFIAKNIVYLGQRSNSYLLHFVRVSSPLDHRGFVEVIFFAIKFTNFNMLFSAD